MKRAKQKRYNFTYCGSCDRKMRFVYRARQRTAYVDDSANFFYGCKCCHKINAEHWDAMWEEYWDGCL